MTIRNLVCKIIFLLVVLFVSAPTFGQETAGKKFKALSSPEKTWVLLHPFVAKKALKLSEQARAESKSLLSDPRLDGDDNGGQIDAFRHAYWMALLSQHMCWRKAKSLGIAHEKGNYKNWKMHKLEDKALPDSMASVMDLSNNSFGINFSKQKGRIEEDSLKERIVSAILEGKLAILWKNEEGKFLDCNGFVPDDQPNINKWNKPRCLVPSDHSRKPIK